VTERDQRPIIVVRRVVKPGGGHHGGAWKVAYADFVTAMMAFFLLMWLLGAASQDQKAAISEFFNNPSAEMGISAMPKPGGMEGPGGASNSPVDLGGGFDLPTAPQPEAPPDPALDPAREAAAAEAWQERQEQARMEALKTRLEAVVAADPALAGFRDQLLIDLTDEGLRLQIVDREQQPMFEVGSARLLPGSERVLGEIAGVVARVPNRISITGHTDARPYIRSGYGNWELSADRANAARRQLEAGGLPPAHIARVVGLADSVLFDPAEPMAPINRRIAIIVLKQKADAAAAARAGPGP
jgi:chemotaxis protein MotB